MNLLLDTNVVIWALFDDRKLPSRARQLISSPSNRAYVSAISMWEIAIKHDRGKKTDLPMSGTEALDACLQFGYRLLDVTPAHAAAVEGLPKIDSDPFDRLLVAQAVSEPMRLVTSDAVLAQYNESVILV